MGDGPNPKAKWSKYKVEDGKLVRASTARTADLVSSWPFTTIESRAAAVATPKRLSDVHLRVIR